MDKAVSIPDKQITQSIFTSKTISIIYMTSRSEGHLANSSGYEDIILYLSET